MEGKIPMMSGMVLVIMVLSVLGGLWIADDASGQSPSIILERLEMTSLIKEHYSVTEFLSIISNPSSSSQEVVLSLNVPENGMLSNISLSMDGRTTYGHVTGKAAASETYDAAKEQGRSAVQVANPGGKGSFKVSLNLGAGKQASLRLRYEQVIVKVLGLYGYSVDCSSLKGPGNFNGLSASIWVRCNAPILEYDTTASTIDIKSERYDDRSINITHHSTPASNGVIFLKFREAAPPLNGTMLTYRNGRDAYFMHVFSPDLEGLGGSQLPKDIIFVLDHSGSMSGEKISQMKEAFSEIVGQLYEQDMFNIVIFDDRVKTYRNEMIVASLENRKDASDHIRNIYADGSTNINEALIKALDMFKESSERVPVGVFLTDGLPTAGVTSTADIRKNILNANDAGVSIYAIGFGNDVDSNFLRALSLENEGFATFIPTGKDAGSLLKGFYEGISTPLLKDLRFSYGPGASRVLPETVPGLYDGSEVIVCGMFDPGVTTLHSLVKARSSIGNVTFESDIPVSTGSGTELVARLWAHRRILSLLDSITVVGEQKELVDQIVELGIRFTFSTPYTSFILVVRADEKIQNEIPVPEDKEQGDSRIFPQVFDDDDSDEGPISFSKPDQMSSFPVLFLFMIFIISIIALIIAIAFVRGLLKRNGGNNKL
ncbi:MAG: VWA domain-containing protein [Candidatus Thermoplasmatota archaeon]|jgi:uncharacterized protein YegL|nr:VWA domain-containing protein [Candidatus Thermoplasmatota archaeon]